MIRVEIDMAEFVGLHGGEAEAQFLMRRRLEAAGIPLAPPGPGGTKPARGVLRWRDDYARDLRIVEWHDEEESKQ